MSCARARIQKGKRLSGWDSGQAAVETALVMPLFVFITLGILQLSLLHQARLLTKYAAFKAVRSGALYGANKQVMKNAALAVLLPIAGRPDKDAMNVATTPAKFIENWSRLRSAGAQHPGGIPIVDVTICGPLRQHTGPKVDFDDPNTDDTHGVGRFDWSGRQFDRSRLSIQVTFYYRMLIPFVNGVLWWMVYGKEDPNLLRTLRMGPKTREQIRQENGGNLTEMYNDRENGSRQRTLEDLLSLAKDNRYVLPIRASYLMRMHSNPELGELPQKNFCVVPWKKGE